MEYKNVADANSECHILGLAASVSEMTQKLGGDSAANANLKRDDCIKRQKGSLRRTSDDAGKKLKVGEAKRLLREHLLMSIEQLNGIGRDDIKQRASREERMAEVWSRLEAEVETSASSK